LLVLGIGNLLLSDDGVGVHAVRELRKQPRAGVLVTEVGTAILDTVSLLAWADRVLVIDALHAKGASGTIYWAPFANILQSPGRLSLHELDLSAALALMPRDLNPPEIYVLGVEPGSLDVGLELSPPVLAALPQVVAMTNSTLRSWRSEVATGKSIASADVLCER
jgi:hydrogenase maturation protease